MRKLIVLAAVFGLVVVVFQSWPFWQNAVSGANGDLIFRDAGLVSDSNIHISLINEMTNRFPPTNFAQTGSGTLKNYHYYFDAFWAIVGKVLPGSVFTLYYRIMPVVVSFCLVVAIYFSVWRLSRDRLTAAVAILWVVFSSSLGPLIARPSNVFMTDQIYPMLINPQGVASLIVFLALFLCLSMYKESKRVFFLVIFAILLGLSFGIKAYGGVVFGVAAVVAGVWFYIKDRDIKPLVFTALGLGIIFFSVRSIIDGKAAGLAFYPFWILDKMVEDTDRLNQPNLFLLKEHYLVFHNWLRLILLTMMELGVYVVGSLGLRVVGFIAVGGWLVRWKKLSPEKVFLLGAATTSLAIPLLFNQTKSAYNVVQFTAYFTLFMGIAATLAVFGLIRRFSWPLHLIIIGGMTIVGALVIRQDIKNQFNPDKGKIIIDADSLKAADFVQRNTPAKAVFFLAESPIDQDSLWFTALTKRRTAYSGGYFIDLAGGDRVSAKGTAAKTNFGFVWARRQVVSESDKIGEQEKWRPVYKNDSIVVYQVVK